jgi:SagB-type dehydrogenase family enzyme
MSDRTRVMSHIVDYHQRSKHRPDAYARGPETLDWDQQPDPFRRYDGAPLTSLPFAAAAETRPYAALWQPSSAPCESRPLVSGSIALLLEMSLALSAWKQYGGARWSLRCNPSSGNLHPTEAYIVAVGIEGLDSGIYHYRADLHALEQRCHLADALPGELSLKGLWLGFSSVYWREAWKYGERAYRYCQHDVGHAVAAVGFAASSLGWSVRHCEIGDQQLADLLGLGHASAPAAEVEHPDCLLWLDHAESRQLPVFPREIIRAAASAQWQGQANVLDRRHLYQWPVIEEAGLLAIRPDVVGHEPVDGEHAQNPASEVGHSPYPPPIPSSCDDSASRIFRQRRSAQAFDGATLMAQQDFFTLLDHCLPRSQQAPWSALPANNRIHLIVFVHRVEGLAPGLYVLPRSVTGLSLLQEQLRPEFQWQAVESAPAHLNLHLLLAAKAGKTAARLSCQQAIAGDSCFSLAMLAEFEPLVQHQPWVYRELLHEAGAIGQVLYLDAEASRLRGTGIGCYYDDAVHELLGIQGQRLQSLYHFTVGAPLNDPRIVSWPPYRPQEK